MTETVNKNSVAWDRCPTEILLIIFKQLDSRSLNNCMFVNTRWRALANYVSQLKGIWEQLVKENIPNNGLTYRKKSNLTWRETFHNYLLWREIYTTKMENIHLYTTKDVKNIHIYKDQLIIVCDLVVKYYNVNLHKLIKKVDTICIDFDETDKIIIKLTNEGGLKKLFMYGKRYKKDFSLSENHRVFHKEVIMYKLEDDCCYVIDTKNTLWCYRWRDHRWAVNGLARYYGHHGAIRALNVNHNSVYVMLKWGDILEVLKYFMSFQKMCYLNVPNYMTDFKPVMFDVFSTIVGVPNNKKFKINSKAKANQMVVECPDLTCATEHGDILFLGFKDGRVEICMPKYLKKNYVIPEFPARIAKHLNDDPAVVAVDVFESQQGHHLFVAKRSHISQILLTHPS